ncbi:MAG: hypothetical protein VW452_01435 [Pelagibacteraceae bacterium]
MKLWQKKIILTIISFLIFGLFLFYTFKYFLDNTPTIFEFHSEIISGEFESEIANNANDINSFLKDYSFIKSYLVKKNLSKIDINIEIKEPFAKNIFNKEIIFMDSTTASFNYFNDKFINQIPLIDISKETLVINQYLSNSFERLNKLFNISNIEYIDSRRYNLILDNNLVVMLPKIINEEFLMFIENNLNLLENNTNYSEYLDLRNFHEKTIRLK